MSAPIGIFDSGYGGLTILREIRRRLPLYDYVYLGDNARAPYGPRSFDVVYSFTLQAVKRLFDEGCRLVVLACNTASAKALRSIQQNDLPLIDPSRRVLGVIRPTVEALGDISANGHVALIGTIGTVNSHSYRMECEKLYPDMRLTEIAAPMWVPLVENNEADSPGADFFVKKYLGMVADQDPDTDTIVLGCTHYPLLLPKILEFLPGSVRKVVAQGTIVADSLAGYLLRHPEIETRCAKGGRVEYLTTESPEKFSTMASLFMDEEVSSTQITL